MPTRFPARLRGSIVKTALARQPINTLFIEQGVQLGTATDSLSPPERGEGWGEGI